jgi:hypothetical protein
MSFVSADPFATFGRVPVSMGECHDEDIDEEKVNERGD